jgi:hypothetical protein
MDDSTSLASSFFFLFSLRLMDLESEKKRLMGGYFWQWILLALRLALPAYLVFLLSSSFDTHSCGVSAGQCRDTLVEPTHAVQDVQKSTIHNM